MDGLLIDSEPFWEQVEIKVFKSVGVPISTKNAKQTTGLRTDEVVEYWYSKFPWEKLSKKLVLTMIVNQIIDLINKKGVPKKGAYEVIKLFHQQNIPMAIASSSADKIINTVVKKLSIAKYMKVTWSAEHEKRGKPHPAVYLTTSKKLGVLPKDCLVFEDSPNGVLAAKAAGMKCIAIPEEKLKHDSRLNHADLIIDSLSDFSLELIK